MLETLVIMLIICLLLTLLIGVTANAVFRW